MHFLRNIYAQLIIQIPCSFPDKMIAPDWQLPLWPRPRTVLKMSPGVTVIKSACEKKKKDHKAPPSIRTSDSVDLSVAPDSACVTSLCGILMLLVRDYLRKLLV